MEPRLLSWYSDWLRPRRFGVRIPVGAADFLFSTVRGSLDPGYERLSTRYPAQYKPAYSSFPFPSFLPLTMRLGRLESSYWVEAVRNVMAHGDAWEGK